MVGGPWRRRRTAATRGHVTSFREVILGSRTIIARDQEFVSQLSNGVGLELTTQLIRAKRR